MPTMHRFGLTEYKYVNSLQIRRISEQVIKGENKKNI